MTAVVDISGHFGSRLSYATVGSEVAKALFSTGALGAVHNLDESWHPDHEWLRGREGHGSHLIIFSEPRHFFGAHLPAYGAERVAVFASPNTDRMGREQSAFCAEVGRVFTPSKWCADAVTRSLQGHPLSVTPPPCIVPLGASPYYLGSDTLRARRSYRTAELPPLRVLHVATDHVWPGRKGTLELIQAWAMARANEDLGRATLTIHAPRSAYEQIHYAAATARLLDHVNIEFPAEATGTTDHDLADLYADHDMLALAPRCEGFGMMILAGLMNEMPTVTTRMTGQEDFLGSFSGWTATPVGLAYEELAYEDGEAPVIDVAPLATTLALAVAGYDHLLRTASTNREEAKRWTWPSIHQRWIDAINEWTEETT